jgi:DNA topoisomerase VI subunit A
VVVEVEVDTVVVVDVDVVVVVVVEVDVVVDVVVRQVRFNVYPPGLVSAK